MGRHLIANISEGVFPILLTKKVKYTTRLLTGFMKVLSSALSVPVESIHLTSFLILGIIQGRSLLIRASALSFAAFAAISVLLACFVAALAAMSNAST